MDGIDRSWSTPEIAAILGTSVPRVHRALKALGLSPTSGPKGHLALTSRQVTSLRDYLGQVPRDTGFTREELFVLRTLYVHPLGLRSARAVARHAGVSPTTAAKVLVTLRERSFVEKRAVRVVEGQVVDITVWRLRLYPYWLTHDVHSALAATHPPVPAPGPGVDHLPARFSHLFWNAPAESWRVPEHAGAIATTILEHTDTEALAWAAQTLPTGAFRKAERDRRGTSPRIRQLAHNLAEARSS